MFNYKLNVFISLYIYIYLYIFPGSVIASGLPALLASLLLLVCFTVPADLGSVLFTCCVTFTSPLNLQLPLGLKREH